MCLKDTSKPMPPISPVDNLYYLFRKRRTWRAGRRRRRCPPAATSSASPTSSWTPRAAASAAAGSAEGPRVVWRGGAACAHVARVWCAPVPVSVSCVRVCHVSSVTTFNRGRGENSKLSFNFINFNFQPFLNN